METDHIKMLYDIGELNNLFSESLTIESLLQKIVEMVAKHMDAEVCSIYLYNEAEKELTLKATIGLNPDSVNNVKLQLGEGLVGMSLQELEPVCEKCGMENPNFKFYPGIDEENFQSFLAAPIVRGNIRIGVIVVQRAKDRTFEEQDILALRVTASQLASMIENIKYIISPEQEPTKYEKPVDLESIKFLKGKKASTGFAYSKIIATEGQSINDFQHYIESGRKLLVEDFDKALLQTEKQLEGLQEKVEEKLEDAASLIFSAHLLMLKDKNFTGAMRNLIEQGEDPPQAILKKYTDYRDIFLNSPSPIIREKTQDIEDLTRRLLSNLFGENVNVSKYQDRIAIMRDILPSELLAISAEGVSGIILVSGGVTSHISILSRSLGIPVVIADRPELLDLSPETMVLIDGEHANIYINPTGDIIESFSAREKERESIYTRELLESPAATKDGRKITLLVNINLLIDLKNIKNVYNDGIGLYRTEFPFIIRNNFPSEEEQYFVYRKLVEGMRSKPVTFRTLDIGGDKILSYYQVAREENPFLGMRSIRFSLSHLDIFKQQIRAILRAGYNSEIKIMFPMISSLDEFLKSREIVFECIRELDSEKIEHNSNPLIGMMVEIPSVIHVIEDLAKEAGFFSIGTNDLIQYTLAVDRTNEKVADMYIAHHPSILKSLKAVSDAGRKHNIEVSICGDMAGDERYIPFLLGIGIHTLSVDSSYLPKVKKIISDLKVDDTEKIAEEMLSKRSIEDINKIIEKLEQYNLD